MIGNVPTTYTAMQGQTDETLKAETLRFYLDTSEW